jgi:hypothetical protein
MDAKVLAWALGGQNAETDQENIELMQQFLQQVGHPPPLTAEDVIGTLQQQEELEQLAKRLHTALDDVICIFVSTPNIKYGDYHVLDAALDTLAASARRLNLPLTVSIANVIETKHGLIWTEQGEADA